MAKTPTQTEAETTTGLPPESYMTEQDKAAAAGTYAPDPEAEPDPEPEVEANKRGRDKKEDRK
jgi:hypothetical protein